MNDVPVPFWIESPSNPTVRQVAKLRDRRERNASQAFVVEGQRDVMRAIDAGWELLDLFVAAPLEGQVDQPHTMVGDKAMAKMSYRQSPADMLGVFRSRERSLDDLAPKPGDVWLIAVGSQKPGNLGAMLRTGAAAGVSGVVTADAEVDLFNPNVLRNSAGAAFTMPFVAATDEAVRRWVEASRLTTWATVAADDERCESRPPWEVDVPGAPLAIVIGPEHEGLPEAWLDAADDRVAIPTLSGSGVDSLNASVAAAVVLFDVVRRRPIA
jgi:TrmH family RNA methyltransferase